MLFILIPNDNNTNDDDDDDINSISTWLVLMNSLLCIVWDACYPESDVCLSGLDMREMKGF